jgi:hypothetical protein
VDKSDLGGKPSKTRKGSFSVIPFLEKVGPKGALRYMKLSAFSLSTWLPSTFSHLWWTNFAETSPPSPRPQFKAGAAGESPKLKKQEN